ncbi:hypothetical protein FHJ31_04155 [Pseudomonas sp. Fig-3]|jgi:hypothetical protein|uniref:Uncharacterized protein n=1 Tax=Pseudomonas rhizophila TaxID=2045200 RepID=A0ABN5JXY2_9PSED|nr:MULTISPECIES: hypothetical protein [Pseudomonas]AVU78242.1 hypothetical protein CRX69_24855 [Pseudomonas rhizophila]MDD2032816.1 hypothetical protein [Pseudomonas sp. 39167]MEA1032317.1 hypothetical protein [Pseudomonas sp. N-137]QKJ33829.1 hypothetical protein HQ912_02845 [Pseudomonas sp. MPDS]TNB88552.1 hypothetical protein FHJ31_04155 [Pseudomonas sp. Fig-3]
MHGSADKDERHSTPQTDQRSKLLPRVMGSLAIFGLMVGLMIGRLTTPEPSVLQQVEVIDGTLVAWFNNEPKLHGEIIDGSVALLLQAEGRPQKGQLKLNGKDVNWRVRLSDKGLLLTLVAARPLRGEWAGSEVDDRWRLEIRLQEQ